MSYLIVKGQYWYCLTIHLGDKGFSTFLRVLAWKWSVQDFQQGHIDVEVEHFSLHATGSPLPHLVCVIVLLIRHQNKMV